MAYIIIDDRSPESDEYSNNYIYFDEKKPGTLQKMMQLYRRKEKAKQPAYEILCDICSSPCCCS